MRLNFIELGKPLQKCVRRELQRSPSDEYLRANWSLNIAHGHRRIEAWRLNHNVERPHNSLGYRPPNEFAASQRVTSVMPSFDLAILRTRTAGTCQGFASGRAPRPVRPPKRFLIRGRRK
jgi:hypothetical protein